MRSLAIFLFLQFLSIDALADSILIDGAVRRFILDVPHSESPAPLIVVFHGLLGSAKQIRATTQLSDLANSKGVVVVYPDSLGGFWNDGRVTPSGKLFHNVDDVGFITNLVHHLEEIKLVDPERIVFAGVSNGGMMSFRMACASSISAFGVAAISANIPKPIDCSKAATRLLNIVGTDDQFIPMAGGFVLNIPDRGSVESSENSFAQFVRANECSGTNIVELADNEDDEMSSAMTIAEGCTHEPVAQIIVSGGGHAWAGSSGPMEILTGKPTMDFSASQLIVNFILGEPLLP